MRKIFLVFILSASLFANIVYDINIELNTSDNIVQKIQNIVEKNKNKSIKISLKRGEYILPSSSTQKQLIKLSNINKFSFDGNSSKLLIAKESVGLFFFHNSTNIKISNLEIDYKFTPKVTTKILSIDKKRKEMIFEVVKKDFVSLKKNLQNKTKHKLYGIAYESPGIVKEWATPVTFVENIEHIKKRKYKLRYKKLHNVQVGDVFVLVFRYQSALFRMVSSSNLSFKNITVYASPSGVFVGNRTSSTFFDNCNVLLKKGEYLSSNADVFHFQSARKGPHINNSTLEGVGDDIVALYTKPMYVVKQLNDKELVVSKNSFLMKDGDGISFFNRKIGKIVFITKVKKITRSKKNNIVEFDTKIPKDIEYSSLRLYDRETTSKGFVIENSTFRNSRRHGCYIKAFDGKIINNEFINLGGSAIAIKNEPRWPEGLNSENILIKDNKMLNCGYGINRKQPLIDKSFRSFNGLSQYKEHKNIAIVNNKTEDNELITITTMNQKR